MKITLHVDEKEISMNDFVSKIMIGTIVGAVMSLRGINENWKDIKIEIEK